MHRHAVRLCSVVAAFAAVVAALAVAVALAPAAGATVDAGAVTAPVAGATPVSGMAPVAGTSADAARRGAPARNGGPVRSAWPASGARGRPQAPIARWLARQVGPLRPLAVPSAARGRAERIELARPTGDGALLLVRSFEIPADDPAHERLLNWAWTSDSALVATAFSAIGQTRQAGRLLDQLAALQRRDGSIEFAFDVRSGESSAQVRSGPIALAGIAFVAHDASGGRGRFLNDAGRAADHLLSLRGDDGLVRGGPDVRWVSAQHNLLTHLLLTGLAEQLEAHGREDAAMARRVAADAIAAGIDRLLVVRQDGVPTHLRQGVDDDVTALETQTLGVLYARARGDDELAARVYAFARERFAVSGRSVRRSGNRASYNMTYAAKGPFSGHRPYLDRGSPDVLWFEGTAQLRFLAASIGEPTADLDASIRTWLASTRGAGPAPLGADRTITTSPFNEYHVWPTAAAAAWTLIARAPDNGLTAPGR